MEHATTSGVKLENETNPKLLYPITQAVKEWMCKTRETTPDVEILKSPSTIYKEFCDSASETETDSKNISASEINVSLDDEEITVFIKETEKLKEGSVEKQDLLEYWENEIEVHKNIDLGLGLEANKSFKKNNYHNGYLEQGEDVLEIYDSKYGKNEDYVNLQKEIKEKQRNFNQPKSGNLPYRAICCSIV